MTLAMKIGGVGEMSEVRREHFVSLAEKAKIRPQLVLNRLDSLAKRLPRKATELKERLSDEGNPSPIYDEIIATIGRHIAQTSSR